MKSIKSQPLLPLSNPNQPTLIVTDNLLSTFASIRNNNGFPFSWKHHGPAHNAKWTVLAFYPKNPHDLKLFPKSSPG